MVPSLSLRPGDLAQFLFCRRTFVLEIRGRRVGCRRIGSEAYTVHWFPTARQRPPSLFKLNPVELPLEIPCPAEYVVVYFDASGRPFATPCFKLFLRGRVISVNWSDGDRRLLIVRSSS